VRHGVSTGLTGAKILTLACGLVVMPLILTVVLPQTTHALSLGDLIGQVTQILTGPQNQSSQSSQPSPPASNPNSTTATPTSKSATTTPSSGTGASSQPATDLAPIDYHPTPVNEAPALETPAPPSSYITYHPQESAVPLLDQLGLPTQQVSAYPVIRATPEGWTLLGVAWYWYAVLAAGLVAFSLKYRHYLKS
jgi:cytoskeletal protein RodZ